MYAAQIKEDNLPLRSGPALGYNVIGRVSAADTPNILARNPDNTMLFVQTSNGTGWAVADAIGFTGEMAQLAVWKNPMVEHTFTADTVLEDDEPEPISGTVTATSDFKTGPSYAYETITWIPDETPVTLQAKSEDGHWVYVSAGTIGGWLPLSKIATEDDLTPLPTAAEPEEGTTTYMPRGVVDGKRLARRRRPRHKAKIISIIQPREELKIIATNKNRRWLFVIAAEGDGWVQAKRLNLLGAAELEKVTVWQEAVGS